MNHQPYEIGIEEIHHTEKKDAPSGTAITLAETVLSESNSLNHWELISDNHQDTTESGTLPIAAYLLTLVYTNTKTYLKIWLLSIPVSLVLGGFWEGLFKSFGFFEDERLNTYLTDTDAEVMSQFSNTGFRWDFLLYSLTGIYAGWYFIVKKGYEDKIYSQIFNTYVLANAFWILVIRASFSNRFAYLSWFLLGIVTIYPLLKLKFFQDLLTRQ